MIIEARDDVVSLSGSLEHNYWPAIQAAANLLLRIHPNGILIDASQVNYCCEDGVHTFVDAMEYIERHNARIVVCHPPDEVKSIIKQTPGARSRLALADTCDQGRASLELAHSTRREHRAARIQGAELHSRPRLVMIPLLGGVGGLKETIGLAIKMASVRVGHVDDEVKQSKIAPLLHFIYVLEIPRSMPLSAPMTEEEEAAKIALTEATTIAEDLGLVCQSSVSRAREVGEEIATEASKIAAEMIFVTMPSQRNAPGRDRIEPILDALFQRARCEVVVKNWPS